LLAYLLASRPCMSGDAHRPLPVLPSVLPSAPFRGHGTQRASCLLSPGVYAARASSSRARAVHRGQNRRRGTRSPGPEPMSDLVPRTREWQDSDEFVGLGRRVQPASSLSRISCTHSLLHPWSI
jgi:hypothetical protein